MEKNFLRAENGLKFIKERNGGLTFFNGDQDVKFHTIEEVEEAFRDICKNNIIYPDHTAKMPHCKPRATEVKMRTSIDYKTNDRIIYVEEAYYSYYDVNVTHLNENKNNKDYE